MPVVPHDAESDDAHAELCDGFAEDVEKRLIISAFLEDRLPAITSIHDVVDASGRCFAACSCHAILIST